MNYGKQELKAVRVNVEGRVSCPVTGWAHSVPRQQRHFRRASEFRCPDHGIYISPSTFEYDDPLNNLLWRDADDVRLLETLKGVKRESRMARERSEGNRIGAMASIARFRRRRVTRTSLVDDFGHGKIAIKQRGYVSFSSPRPT